MAVTYCFKLQSNAESCQTIFNVDSVRQYVRQDFFWNRIECIGCLAAVVWETIDVECEWARQIDDEFHAGILGERNSWETIHASMNWIGDGS